MKCITSALEGPFALEDPLVERAGENQKVLPV